MLWPYLHFRSPAIAQQRRADGPVSTRVRAALMAR
jgi:hypothetical protein